LALGLQGSLLRRWQIPFGSEFMAPGTTDFGHLVVLTLILKDTQLDHTHLAVQHRHFGWYIMLV